MAISQQSNKSEELTNIKELFKRAYLKTKEDNLNKEQTDKYLKDTLREFITQTVNRSHETNKPLSPEGARKLQHYLYNKLKEWRAEFERKVG